MLTGMFLKNAYKCLGSVVREMAEYALFTPGKSYTLMEDGITVSGGGGTIGLMNSIDSLNRHDMEKWFNGSICCSKSSKILSAKPRW